MKRQYFSQITKCIAVSVSLLISVQLTAQIPSGYYNGASGQSGATLKSTLHDIIKGHTEYPYSSSGTDVWDILKVADKDPNNSNNVIGLYSNFSMNAAAEYANGAGWNREHVWAKSRGNFGTSPGPGTDLHHLRATDITTNSARDNRNFDEAFKFLRLKYQDEAILESKPLNQIESAVKELWQFMTSIQGLKLHSVSIDDLDFSIVGRQHIVQVSRKDGAPAILFEDTDEEVFYGIPLFFANINKQWIVIR